MRIIKKDEEVLSWNSEAMSNCRNQINECCRCLMLSSNLITNIKVPAGLEHHIATLNSIIESNDTSARILLDIKNELLSLEKNLEDVEKQNEQLINDIFDKYFNEKCSFEEILEDLNVSNTKVKCGEFYPVDEKYIAGYYITTNGKKVTIFNQHYQDDEIKNFLGIDWNQKCNRAAAIIIASMYSEKSSEELIQEVNGQYKNTRGLVIPDNGYWEEFGLERSDYTGWMPTYSGNGRTGYTEVLSEHLQEGGYAMIHLKQEKKYTYRGKSKKTEWTKEQPGEHWISIVDYKIVDGQEKIAVADYRGVEWYDIDEFDKNISNMVLIKER